MAATFAGAFIGPSSTLECNTDVPSAAKDIGAQWVRIWLFEDGQGLVVDSNRYVTGLKSDFKTNFNDVLSHAAANGIKVYPTFFNYAPDT
jgi:2-keto-3-deoxy-galactonokinase